MTSAATTSLDTVDSPQPVVSRAGWVAIGVIGLLFVLVHGIYLERLYRIVTRGSGDNLLEVIFSGITSTWDPNWSHALVVPLISLYFIYQHRDRLAAAPVRPCLWGLPIAFMGLVGYAFWISPGRNDMLQGYSMIVTLFGVVLLLLGPAMMRVLWFPVLYLTLAVKISDRIWEALAMKLQLIAAQGSSIALNIIGVFIDLEADVEGSQISLIHRGVSLQPPLDVAQACAGLRMLMAFIALGVAMAFLWQRPWWQRLAMIAMTIPIAVGVNIGRVTTLGLLHLVDPKYATGDFHTFIGLLMLIPAAGAFLLLGWVLDRIVIRDEEPADRAPKPRPTPPTPVPPVGRRDVGPLAAAVLVGVVASLAAAGVYAYMLGIPSPGEWLRARVSTDNNHLLLVAMILKMLWIAAPVALVGTAIGLGALRALRGAGKWAPVTAMTAGVLLSMFVMHQVVAARTGWVPIKEPVPLQRPLVLIPADMGPWRLVQEMPPLPPDILQELGTQQYITRVYEDTTWPDQAGRYVVVHIPYYTGTADTVPHVPERCFLGGGMVGLGQGTIDLKLSGQGYRPDEVNGGFLHDVKPTVGQYAVTQARIPAMEFNATYFTFGTRNGAAAHNVLYFFASNGKFRPSPDAVRFDGFDPTDQYSYYCKIEVQMQGIADPEEAARRAETFLSAALPEIMACLPDWVEVTEGRYPRDAAASPAPPTTTPSLGGR